LAGTAAVAQALPVASSIKAVSYLEVELPTTPPAREGPTICTLRKVRLEETTVLPISLSRPPAPREEMEDRYTESRTVAALLKEPGRKEPPAPVPSV